LRLYRSFIPRLEHFYTDNKIPIARRSMRSLVALVVAMQEVLALGQAPKEAAPGAEYSAEKSAIPSTQEGPQGAKAAAVAAEGATPAPSGALDTITEVLTKGKLSFDLRLRAELASQSGLRFSEAYTSRIRIGYSTRPWHGLSAFAELEDIRAVDDSLYNAAGLNGQPTRTVIADPPDTELNQLFARFQHDSSGADLIGGRQKIILDDWRFVGDVGWRQNQQTFDAVSAKSTFEPLGFKDLELFYAYLWEVNRIFGPDSNRDFDSDSHLVNAKLSVPGLPAGCTLQTVGFAYFIDLDNAATSSSDSFGLRVTGSHKITDALELSMAGSFAHQVDSGDNPNDYDAEYYALEGSLGLAKIGKLGAGYERLGDGEGVASFSTPLATLHRFNGWADVFLATPANGLEDVYATLQASLPFELEAMLVPHLFFEDAGGSRLGSEIDAQVSRKITKEILVLAKYARFDGHNGLPDVERIWFEVNIRF
jgi:hypothetical protein